MKHLIIIGARGFGRELYFLAQNAIGYGSDFDIKGYLDDKEDALASYFGFPPILSSVENYIVHKDDVFICALGDVRYKRKYVELILQKHGEFISLVHKNATILPTASVGKGCIIFQNVQVSTDVCIGDFVTLQPMVFLGHDAVIGNWCHLNTNCVCNGLTVLEEMVTLHTGAIIAPKIQIGKSSIVGAGSVVFRNVQENVTVLGNPAKKIFG